MHMKVAAPPSTSHDPSGAEGEPAVGDAARRNVERHAGDGFDSREPPSLDARLDEQRDHQAAQDERLHENERALRECESAQAERNDIDREPYLPYAPGAQADEKAGSQRKRPVHRRRAALLQHDGNGVCQRRAQCEQQGHQDPTVLGIGRSVRSSRPR